MSQVNIKAILQSKRHHELLEILEKVQEMRAAQKKYFADRTKANLDKSIKLEREIDLILRIL